MVVTYTCEQFVWNASSWPTLSATMQQHWLQRTPIERLNALMQTHRKQVVDGKDSKNKSRFRGARMYVQTNTSYRVFSFCCKEGDMNDRCNTIHSIGHATII